MNKVLVLALVIISLGACKKGNVPDTLAPVINITSPSPNQQFGSGATVTIAGSIFDNRELRTVHISVTNKNSNLQVLNVQEQPNERSYEVNKTFVTGSFTVYAILIEAEDFAGNKSQVSFDVRSN